jgi:hypothetical protein
MSTSMQLGTALAIAIASASSVAVSQPNALLQAGTTGPTALAREIWAQMKAALEDTRRSYLPDDVLQSWFLDPAIRYRNTPTAPAATSRCSSKPPVLHDHRPEATTAIPNLFLAADYVRNQSPVDTASMDGANAAARAAVNGLLAASGSRAEPVPIYERYSAPEFQAAKQARRSAV